MAETIKWLEHEGKILHSKNGFDIIHCDYCGFAHQVPIPTQQELDKMYKEEYYTKAKPLYIDTMKRDFDWWQRVYDDRFDTFEQYLPASRRRVLDVGSGTGYFLLQGKNRGWDATGIEPSKQAAEYSRTELGLNIIEAFLSDELAGKLGQKFDVVHMSNVLEHIPDPQKLIETSLSILEPGGVLCISVPNDYNPIQQALSKVDDFAPWWVAPPHHINYFTFESLRKLIEKCGCTFLLQETSFPIDMFLLMGDNYIGNDQLGRECHAKRMNFEKKMAKAGFNDKKRKLYQAMAGIGIGREVIIYAQKK